MQIINIHQAKTNLSKLIASAVLGQEIVIAKAGKPIARIVPYKAVLKYRKPGLLKGKIFVADNFTEEDESINRLFYTE